MFTYVYWIGFAVSVILGLAPIVNVVSIYLSTLHLIVSLSHMLLLALLGFSHVKKNARDNLDVGSRIATMGYLHTLLGVTSALIVVGQLEADVQAVITVDEIRKLLMPVGSALTTSIVGWAVGKELQRDSWGMRIAEAVNPDLDASLQDLVGYLRAWGKGIQEANEQTKKSVYNYCYQLEESARKLSVVEFRSAEVLDNLNIALASIGDSSGLGVALSRLTAEVRKAVDESSKLPSNLDTLNEKVAGLVIVLNSMDELVAKMNRL